MSSPEIITDNIEILWRIGSFLGGVGVGFLGHWFALSRDRRCEFNELADEFDTLLRRKSEYLNALRIKPSEFEDLIRRVPKWRKKRLIQAIAVYDEADGEENKERNVRGDEVHIDREKIRAAIEELLECVRRA
jgi:hypothetical protein